MRKGGSVSVDEAGERVYKVEIAKDNRVFWAFVGILCVL